MVEQAQTDRTHLNTKLRDGEAINLVKHENFNELRLRGLELIHERFSRALRTDLFSTLRRAIEVDFVETKFLKYGELLQSIKAYSSYNVAQMKPLRGTALFILHSRLVYVFVECLFGGDGRFPIQARKREFSQTEQRIIHRIIEIIFSCYAKAAYSIIDLQLEYVRSESNPEFVNIADLDEMMAISVFRLKIANISDEMHICMPWKSLESIRHRLSATSEANDGEVDLRWTEQMTTQVKHAELELVASIIAKQLSVSDIVKIKKGDVLELHNTHDIQVTVNGIPVMDARCGTYNGVYALEVHRLRDLSSFL